MFCDFRCLLLPAAVAFIYIQMRLFATQSENADRLSAAIESENHCTSQLRLLIDQISMQQGHIVALEEEWKRQLEECGQLKARLEDLERETLQKAVDKKPVAAVVIMACNRADYLERTIDSVLKSQSSIASKFPLFVSQVDWKSMELSYLMEEKYLKHFANIVANAKPIHGNDVVLKTYNIEGDMRIQYNNQLDFERIAQQFGIFEEWKDGVPRTAYKGVVVFRHQTARRVLLIGPDSLRQLGISDT